MPFSDPLRPDARRLRTLAQELMDEGALHLAALVLASAEGLDAPALEVIDATLPTDTDFQAPAWQTALAWREPALA